MGPPSREFHSKKLFIAKLILLFLSVEMLFRFITYLSPSWYQEAEQNVRNGAVKYVFIGSSRVACSIDPVEFVQAMGVSNPSRSALNMGTGYSTLVEHYLGLKRLAVTMPGGLKGVTVFLEAPLGVPDMETWHDNWLHPKNPYLLINVITFSDLWAFWAKSNSDFDLKLTVTAGMLSKAFANQGNGKTLLKGVQNIIQRSTAETASRNNDLSASGGVRNDELGIQNARLLAVSLIADRIRNERLLQHRLDDEMVLRSLNDFINAEGGRLILYWMPVSSIWEQIYATAIGRENRRLANGLVNSLMVTMLFPTMEVTDADFPDSWHLRKSRSAEFSKELARVYGEFGEFNVH